jgi:Flp pilus assembly protein TadG
MTGWLRRFGGARGGAAAVEFAAVLGPLLLLIFGVFEFGRLLWTREALQETAIAGARCMGLSATACASGGGYSAANTQSYIEAVAGNWGVTLTGADIALTSNATCAGVTAPNGFSSVTLTYAFQSVAPNFVTALSGGTTLTTTACFPNY